MQYASLTLKGSERGLSCSSCKGRRRAYRHDRGVAASSPVSKHGIVNLKPGKGLVIPKKGAYTRLTIGRLAGGERLDPEAGVCP
jgi:hypothetical protein